MVDRSAREKEPFRDLGVLEPLRHEREYVDLARGQVGRVSSGRRTRASWQPADASRAQPAGDDPRGSSGAEPTQLV